MANVFLNGKWQSVGQTQWAPTLTAHDPNPPITLEGTGQTVIAPSSIASTAAFGTATVIVTQFITPTGMASTAAFGNPNVINAQTITATGIPSGAAFGLTEVILQGFITPAGIGSTVVFGLATVSTPPPPQAVPDTTDCATYGLVPTGQSGRSGAIIFSGRSGRAESLKNLGQSGRSGAIKSAGKAAGANCPPNNC